MSLDVTLIAAGATALALIVGTTTVYEKGRSSGAAACELKTAQAVEKAQADAATQQEAWNEQAHTLSLARANEGSTIASRYAADLARVRQLAASQPVPSAAPSASANGPGGGLPVADGEALVALAERANLIRSALSECTAWIAEVKAKNP